MLNKTIFTTILILLFSFATIITGLAEMKPGESPPVYTGKIINAGTVISINSSDKILLVDSADYDIVTLKVNNQTEIELGDTYADFDVITKGDIISFEGFWSGNLVLATDINLYENMEDIYIDTTVPVETHYAPTINEGYTSSKSLEGLEIYNIVIRKGPENMNLRVNLVNKSMYDAQEKYTIKLYIRENSADEYEFLKEWDETYLEAYNYLSRDFFVYEPSPYLPNNYFEIKAELIDGRGSIFYTYEQIYAGADIL